MDSINLEVEALRDWLETGRPVTVLDIRPDWQREEWSIPGSLHVKDIQALNAGSPSVKSELNLPGDRPVVAVCAEGRTSLFAVRALRGMGVKALSLQGGMRAWSLMWNLAEVPLPGCAAQVTQVRRTGKGCLSYIVASKGEAAVIDASVDPDVYLKIAKDRGLKITHVIDTHVHADHLSRSRLLAERSGAKVCMPEQKRTSYPYQPLRDGDSVTVGDARITAMLTPGHTMESTCYMVEGRALVTGDTLFPAAVGRPDLAADAEQARKRAHVLYATLQKMLTLPDQTLLLPGHTNEPIAFDGQAAAATLEEARRAIPILGATEENFVETLLGRIPPNPANHLEIVRLNEAGEMPPGDVTELEAGANRCAVA